jgi:integrase
MSVYRPAKSRFWHYDFQFKGRRYHGSTGCAAKRDAERHEAEIRRQVALGIEVKPAITVDKACGAWFEGKGKHQRSHTTTIYQLATLAEGLGPNRWLHDLTLRDLDRYIARRRAQVYNASVNRETALMRRVCNWIAARGFDTPALEWREIRLKEKAPETRILTAEEEARLFRHLPASLAPIVEFALISGQRRAEIISLRWADVDLFGGRATVATKGGQRHTFPLTPRLAAIIRAQPKVCAQVFTYQCERRAPKRKDRPARIAGERYPFSRQGWERKWKKALAEAGIENFRFHDTRHTALTRLGSIEAAQRLANHSDIRTTRRYFHTSEDDVRAKMAAAESRNSPEPQEGESAETRRIPPKTA